MAATSKTTKPKPLPFKSAEEILQVAPPETETVEFPEWGTAIRLRPLTRGEWLDCVDAATVEGGLDPKVWGVELLTCAAVEPTFDREQATKLLKDGANAPTERLENAITAMNGYGMDVLENVLKSFLDE